MSICGPIKQMLHLLVELYCNFQNMGPPLCDYYLYETKTDKM